MLKPEQLKSEEFELSVLGGYKREQVDAFFDKVTVDYEKLYNENIELLQKLKVCVSKIEEYQKDEQFLKTAIINAEKLNETALKDIELRERQIEQNAKENAENILIAARAEAEDIVNTARIKSADSIRIYEAEAAEKISILKASVVLEQDKLDEIKKEVSDFKENILKLYKKHLDLLTKLPDYQEKNDVPVNVKPINEPIEEETSEQEVFEVEKQVVDETSTISEQSKASNSEQTAEFVIEKKEMPDDSKEAFERNFKFSGLKFGTDFDVKKDK